MVRHQCYDTNPFITVKCIYYLTFIVPNLIIKYDSLPCCSLSYFVLRKDSTRARTQKILLLVTKQRLYYAPIGTYFYRETPNALYEENVFPLNHNLYLSNKKTIYLKTISSSSPPSHPLGIHPLTPI